METILLTAIGSAAALAAYKGYKSLGLRVVGCDVYPKAWNVNSGDMDEFFQVPYATDTERYIAALLDNAPRYGYTAIAPLTDLEVDALAPMHARFLSAGIKLHCLDRSAAASCRDKLGMSRFLKEHGVCDTIDTYPASSVPSEAMRFPMMLKPLRGRSSSGQMIVNSQKELELAVSMRSDYIAQPFMTGNIYTVDVARDSFGNVAALPREELLRTARGLGTTVRIAPDHPLIGIAANIARLVNIVGVVNIEFIENEGRYYFLEINPRFSGGVGFSCMAGYDFIKASVECYSGESISPCAVNNEMILSQRYEQYITRG